MLMKIRSTETEKEPSSTQNAGPYGNDISKATASSPSCVSPYDLLCFPRLTHSGYSLAMTW